jgi:hypothetical protein
LDAKSFFLKSPKNRGIEVDASINLLEMVNYRMEDDFHKAAQSIADEVIATQLFCYEIR